MTTSTKQSGDLLAVENYSGGFLTDTGELTPILHDVTFSLRQGNLTAIVGETGSGKSLIALSMLGLTPGTFRRTTGSILFDGQDLGSMTEPQWRQVRGSQIAMVFQDARAALNPVLSVGRQLIDACRANRGVSAREARTIATEALRDVRVPEPEQRMRQYPHEFSGGMAQRVMLALALICRPRLLVLDEPTTGLDVTIQADIMELIVEMTRSHGLTACLITHDLGVVAETCDDVVVLFNGRIREVGTCYQVLTDPTDQYTRGLLRASRFEEAA
ncbi:ABC transporter ATP-binding protein [Rhodococcus rhodochrous]|uniref:ABC transporter ATP-binding protein n=1 Tax=Rhodococcus rhodochrous TaxID=1829 RepID=A0AA46X1U4_RHORH|nr:ABC transporter ATP-binding protein [Rhodococcus rhodochrous]UZF48130.1 ABC transporter ATP-binding protein [Rhodococcus rhodochrous]